MSEITVKIPLDIEFEYEKCKRLYNRYQKLIGDDQPFDKVVKNTYFYSFYVDNVLIGGIYCFYRGNRLYLNGFATRHHHNENVECVKMVLSWFECDMYAESVRKPAILCLLKAGFKKYKNNIYIYRR